MNDDEAESTTTDDVTHRVEDAPAPEAVDLPDAPEDQRALAAELPDRAESTPQEVTHDDIATIVALLSTEDSEARSSAAKALQHLYNQPDLFVPYVGELLSAAAAYPEDVEGIPAPAVWLGSPQVRATVYATDSLARVAQRRPDLFVPHVDRMETLLRSDQNVSRYLLFIVGLVEAEAPGQVSREWLRESLCGLLERGRGNGYPSWAADTLGKLDDAEALPAIRAADPGDDADELTREAFDDAIDALESSE
ncbi:MAG: hypothetical protein ABEI27_08205 [Halobellus sp.]|uniref:hypothetical protein n=1 Tax=Halobellus sp. TaxID=1979212 RepID=UPI0035D4121D